MGFLSRWAVFNPKKAVLIWVLVTLAAIGLASAFKGEYNDSFSLPDTESSQAQEVLERQFGGFGGGKDTEEATVVFRVDGDITSEENVARIDEFLAEVAENPSVVSTQSPFAAPAEGAEGDLAQQQEEAQASGNASADPAGTAGAFLAPVSQDGTVARATVVFTAEDDVVKAADVKEFLATVEEANADGFEVGAAGQVVDFSQEDPPPSEGLGILVALVVMALMFGAVVAAGLPIVTAIFGLALGQILVLLMTRFMDIPAFAPILASLIGLGVGIDYSLFVINRFKAAIDAGREPRAAAIEAVNTSGRAVLFAGTTVIIALAGLFILGINFVNGLAVGSMLTVFTVMLSALWLLPALIAWLGARTFALKLPWAKTHKVHPKGTAFARYGAWLQKRPWPLAIVGLIVVVLFALPVGSLQQGFADQSGSKPGTAGRVGYDLLTDGFGPGVNGPFIVVAELPEAGDLESAGALAVAIQETEGVAGASNPIPDNTDDPTQATAAIITVYPETGPQDQATADLLDRLRGQVIPQVADDTGIAASVGGATAIVADFGSVLADALPLFLLVVIGLGILALTVLFRSIVVAVMGALASLLSFGAALGIAVAVFQWGWMKDFFGVEATGPIAPFFPPFLFAILFGLSMDYQVFLVSRMQEEWTHTKDNRRSIRRGLASSGRVVAAAAIIMASVFAGFVLGDSESKLFGLTLAIAILLDAFVIRLVVIPSLMTILGKANWWLPGWLDRVLPHLSVETDDEEYAAEAALIEDVPDADDDVDLDKSPTPAG
jgi:RND superfamily putative drug exporter